MTETFRICGDVGSPVFPDWIARHAARLGVESRLVSQAGDGITLVFSGPPEMLDAMALGCSLGPREVWVDEIVRSGENTEGMLEYPSRSAQSAIIFKE